MLPDEKVLEIVKKSGIDDKSLAKALNFAKETGSNLYSALGESGALTEDKLGAIIAGYYNVPYVSLSKLSIPEDIAHIIPEKVARRVRAIAFARDKDGIKVAMADPLNKDILTTVAKKTGARIASYYAHESEIEGTIQIYKKALQKTIDELLKESIRVATLAKGTSDLPIIKVVEELINAAYQDRASDIHIEPEEKTSLVRFRIDGVLQDVLRVQKELHERIISRIKVL